MWNIIRYCDWAPILAAFRVIQGPAEKLSNSWHMKRLIVAWEAGQRDSRKQKKNVWTSRGAELLLLTLTVIVNHIVSAVTRKYLVIWIWFSCLIRFASGWMKRDDRCFPSRTAVMKVRQVLIPPCRYLPPCLLISMPGIICPLETETKTAGALITSLTVMRPSKSLIPLCSIMAVVEQALMNYYH